jgi:hypothetical protein
VVLVRKMKREERRKGRGKRDEGRGKREEGREGRGCSALDELGQKEGSI